MVLQIDWKINPDNKAELEGFYIKYRKQDQSWEDPVNLSPSETSYTITGLGEYDSVSCSTVDFEHLDIFIIFCI